MKKALLVFIFLLLPLVLCSCGSKEQDTVKNTNNTAGTGSTQSTAGMTSGMSNKTVTFTNGVTDADIWILPETQENKQTTLWGTATLHTVKTGESRQVKICEPGDDGLYILRMIDTDERFYSSNGITLEDGWSLHVQKSDPYSVILEVTDKNGSLNNTYEVFTAKL